MARMRQRFVDADGFMLLELLAVVLILGILIAIAVPTYFGYEARASQAAARSDVRAAVPAVESYRADCGTYANAPASACTDGVAHTFDLAGLKSYDGGLKLQTVKSLAGGASYCIDVTVGGKSASVTGGGAIAATACP